MTTQAQLAAVVMTQLQQALETANQISLVEDVRKYTVAGGMITDIPILREKLRHKRILLSDAQKRRLARAAVKLPRRRDPGSAARGGGRDADRARPLYGW